MKKDIFLNKKAKAIIASAMAVTLAIPSAIMFNGTTPVQAEVDLPDPIAVYDFEDTVKEGITVVENKVMPTIATDAERNSTVLTLNDTIVTPEVVTIVTSAGTDANGNPIVNTEKKVLKEAEYSFSEVTVANPFKGMTELEEIPEFPNKKTMVPYWETGVTISYWQKSTDTDSSVISFKNSREGVVQKDDRDKYNIFNRYLANPTDPLFATGTAVTLEYKSKTTWTDGKQIKGGTAGKTYTILEGCGQFIRFNPEYKKMVESAPEGTKFYYLKPAAPDGVKIRYYDLESIGDPFDIEAYTDVYSPVSQLRYGTSEGGLQFNASGSWAYVECGEVDMYKNGIFFESKSLSQGNHAVAHSFINTTDGKKYQAEALINKPAEWHYITRVIKNDSISTYVDGVLKDREIYTDTVSEATVDTNKGFNVGYGYYTTASEMEEPIFVPKWTKALNMNTEAIAIAPTVDGYTMKVGVGYNGNTGGMTILQMLINEMTTLSFGGQAYGMKDCMGYITETQSGTAIDNVAFFAEPLQNDQVAALYAQALLGDIKAPEKNDPIPQPPTPTPSTGSTVTPEPPTGSPVTPVPPTGSPVTPTTPPVDEVVLGDVDGNGKIELADAQVALQIALKIVGNPTEKQVAAADIDKNNKIELADAKAILKEALKITTNFQ